MSGTLGPSASLMAFVAVSDFDRARAFYEGVLGLEITSADGFAISARLDGVCLRIVKVGAVVVAPYTVLGFRVSGIGARVADLTAKGVAFERYGFLGEAQGPDGVWIAPSSNGRGGDKVAWFKDPDGNLLSLSEHV